MPDFTKALTPLSPPPPPLSLRHLYLLRAKIKAKPIFKRGRKPAENNKNNGNNKETKSILKRKRKLIKINIYFHRNTIINTFLITFLGLVFFTAAEVSFLILILSSFFR